MAESLNLDRSIRILAIEADPTIQSGLNTCLNRFPDLKISAEAEDPDGAWQILTDLARDGLRQRGEEGIEIDLILLGLPFDRQFTDSLALTFCQQVRSRFPQLPILLLATPQDRSLITAFQMGIEGCALRGSSILDLVISIRQVAAGESNWPRSIIPSGNLAIANSASNLGSNWRDRLRSNSIQQIDATLLELNANLDRRKRSALTQWIIDGRKRELTAARWLVKQLFPASDPVEMPMEIADRRSIAITTNPATLTETGNFKVSQTLFDRIAAKLQSGLENLTPTPLEIDILRHEKKQELFYLILRQFEGLLDELLFSSVTIEQLAAKDTILLDLWASITTDFFGRYHTLSTTDRHVEIIPRLLQDADIVRSEILDRIPQSIELIGYLLFKTPLTIDNITYPSGSDIAEDRACALLENLIIQMANAVMQPLLNNFGNLESMKVGFYDRRLLSSREIERFRNDLSWRYRLDRNVNDPRAIFESQYRLFVFTTYGIKRKSIYAPRPEELARLNGIPLVVTLSLEFRDALSPRLASATTFLGGVIVYFLTEIIGRGIGLIGRGVIKGVGNIWQESNRIRKE